MSAVWLGVLAAAAAYQPRGPLPSRTPAVLSCERRVSAAPVAAAWTDLTEDAKRLTDAQTARTVAQVAGANGVLCSSLAADGAPEDGAAFPNAVPFIVDREGCPLMPVASAVAMSNLQQSTMATFYARAPAAGAAAGSVLTLIGEVAAVAEADVDDQQLADVSRWAGESAEVLAARPWVRLVPSRVHMYDAVRQHEAWVAPADYSTADANPLADASAALLHKMNTQHAPALRRFAAVYAGVPPDELVSAELLAVDQMGFDLRVQLGPSAPPSLVRAGFKLSPANLEESTSMFMKLFQEAYERANGSMAV